MATFKLGNFIVLNNISLNEIKTDSELYTYTDTGMIIYEINKPIPVIRNGKCLGLATPTQFTVNSNVTEVSFEFTKLSSDALKVFEKLYANSKNMSSSEENLYDDASAFAGFTPAPTENLADNIRRGKYKHKSRNRSYGFIDNEYDIDDDFDYDNY